MSSTNRTMTLLAFFFIVATLFLFTQFISYNVIKQRIVQRQRWDLNICCGKTDGGGINADIVAHADLPNFVLVQDIYRLPFGDGEFKEVLCSHTIEHVDNPLGFYRELCRVGERVTLVVPPLWDVTAAFNLLEHRSLFLTLRKEHRTLPRFIRLPFSRSLQNRFGQRIRA